ncbi:Dabb family protein [Nocardia transvalensis]|uniref:Dabb family protein n=1 Tax=Nocardia transvalensis TaxID=37333 RepID=UPI001895C547|nr:Dabb family protein [Nocardia transvalensis]MBF6328462.1 Dabb family protein [Nocardia transvalensis]
MSTLRQVMLCTWKPGTTQEQIQLVGERLTPDAPVHPGDQKHRIRSRCPVSTPNRSGPRRHAPPPNYDFAIVQDFANQQSYLAYRDHPAHQAIAEECFLPILAQAATIQFQLE